MSPTIAIAVIFVSSFALLIAIQQIVHEALVFISETIHEHKDLFNHRDDIFSASSVGNYEPVTVVAKKRITQWTLMGKSYRSF